MPQSVLRWLKLASFSIAGGWSRTSAGTIAGSAEWMERLRLLFE